MIYSKYWLRVVMVRQSFGVSGWFIKRSVSGAEEKRGVMRLLV